MLLRRSIALVVLFTASACDPEAVPGPIVGPPADQAPDPAKAAAAAAAADQARAHEADADAFAVCMAGCIEGKAQSPTDRQTCRLTCGADRLADGEAGPARTASASTTAALARFETCKDAGCGAIASTTDAATCRLNCAQTALAGSSAPALTGAARGCAVSCLEQVGDCEAVCTGNADAVATCRLQCTSLGRNCLGRCEADPSATPTIPATSSEAKTKAAAGDEAKVSVPERPRAALPSPH